MSHRLVESAKPEPARTGEGLVTGQAPLEPAAYEVGQDEQAVFSRLDRPARGLLDVPRGPRPPRRTHLATPC
ncbi:hypothetical protein [Streptomyces chrestomyceticus]|uniref:hypothetical protein n=1 Tax=Streptomyces chrestomyceticus TaxID=68185 RepID=UPI0037982577